jgi:diguanylate cyclase (GGDEF)-like protein
LASGRHRQRPWDQALAAGAEEDRETSSAHGGNVTIGEVVRRFWTVGAVAVVLAALKLGAALPGAWIDSLVTHAVFAGAVATVVARCVVRPAARLVWASVALATAAIWGTYLLGDATDARALTGAAPGLLLVLFLAGWIRLRSDAHSAGRWLGALSAGTGGAALLTAAASGVAGPVDLGAAPSAYALAAPYAWLVVTAAALTVVVLSGRRADLPLHTVLVATVVGFGATAALAAGADTGVAVPLGRSGLWVTAVLLAVAAWLPPAAEDAPRTRVAMPVSAALGAGSLALLVGLGQRAGLVALVLATACIAATVARAVVGELEERRLAGSREDALTDELTGLGNRRRLAMAIATALTDREPDEYVGLVLVDLDRFKEVNDTLGHQIGDALLRAVSSRMADAAGEHLLVRMGGDEFALLLGPTPNGRAAQAAAHALVAALDEPIAIGELLLRTRASAGVALVPTHAMDAVELMRCADVAMYEAKTANDSDGVAMFDAEVDTVRRNVVRRTDELRVGVARGDLVVHYQPEVKLSDGSIVGIEALVRWRHPTEGLLAPQRFLSLAEQADLMPTLTRIVLDTSLAHARKLADGGRPLELAVNLSPSCLLDPHLPRIVAELMAKHGVPPGRLMLELTEDALLPDPGRAADVIAALRAHGARLALDDFGTGFASLSYLRTFDVDAIKLDRSFVSRTHSSPRDRIIVESTIKLGHALGLTVVGEGVETESAYRTLREMGCDLAQGFLIGEPMSYSDLKRYLLKRGPRGDEAAGPDPAKAGASASALRALSE